MENYRKKNDPPVIKFVRTTDEALIYFKNI